MSNKVHDPACFYEQFGDRATIEIILYFKMTEMLDIFDPTILSSCREPIQGNQPILAVQYFLLVLIEISIRTSVNASKVFEQFHHLIIHQSEVLHLRLFFCRVVHISFQQEVESIN